MKKISILLIVLLVAGLGYLFFVRGSSVEIEAPDTTEVEETDSMEMTGGEEVSTTTETVMEETDDTKTVIATSVNGAPVTAYHFGTGEKEVLFIGGVHGGYSWNTVLVAYELMDYLTENPTAVPEGVRVTVIPVFNPDGLEKIVGTTERFVKADVPANREARIPGRFNANNVDLNRNFDCEWQSSGTWQNRTVDGGTSAFSEPESQGLKEYTEKSSLDAVVVWYSAAGGVFSSSCRNGVSLATKEFTQIYAKASGYKAYEEFDFYEITGDMVNWFAKERIPAISVLLSTHEDIEWEKNKAGIDALLAEIAK